ncbi:O-Antigen ligase [Rhodospirillales bacterium URHD0017]|nr:O-Antigen ligase [Rhodospirillales bacterium URHD0017]
MTVAQTAVRVNAALASIPPVVRAFLNFHCFVLAGFVVLGKNFAYIGYPPLYIGEVCLAFGIVAALRGGNLAAAIFSLPGLALALLMLWTACRSVPYWDVYGFDAPRDAMLVFYGLFAYVVASLILLRPVILKLLLERYARFIPFIVFLSPVIPVIGYVTGDVLGLPLVVSKVGTLACHLTAVLAFSLIGFVRLGRASLLFILLVNLFAFSQAREAMLAFIVGCFTASVCSPGQRALRSVVAIAAVGAVVLGVLAVVDFKIPGQKEGRDFAVRQLVVNLTSVFETTGSERADVTKEWRLNWWSDIMNYTFYGAHFWDGKGFGPNLADVDGYQVGDPELAPPLRSPHNSHMTILARGGVPAFVLWIATLGSWFVAVVHRLIEARTLGDDSWARVFAFLLTYWTMMVVCSTFDVVLEGPQLGIWFWTVHGIGLAALILHRHRVATSESMHFRATVGGA